jgi:hypothetical protein
MVQPLQQWEERGEIDLYYFDEAGFSQTPTLPYAWSPGGQPVELPAFSHSKRLNILRFMSRRGTLIHHATTAWVTTDVVIEAFEKLIAKKTGETMTVVLMDNAQIHRSVKFRRERLEWVDHGVFVLYLPPYSPELNLIEILWRRVKYEWLPVFAYLSFEKLCDNVRQVLSGYG